MNHYEKRYITHFGGNNLSSLFDDDVSDLTLMQSLNNNSKIVLLGNPGIGKTTELKVERRTRCSYEAVSFGKDYDR